MTYRILALLLLLTLVVSGGWAQSGGPTNLLHFSMGFSGDYDDNLANNSTTSSPEALFTVSPSVQWNLSRNHVIWALDYAGSEAWSGTRSGYRRRTHGFGMDFQYQASKRLTLTATNNFSKSSDPYYQPHQSEFVSGPGIIDRPNTSFFGTSTDRTNEQVGANISYRLSARSDVGLGGSFAMLSYESGAGSAKLSDSYVVGGHANFNHQFSPRRSVGASYNVMKITSPAGWYTMSHRALLTHNFKISATNELNVFAGPEYVSNSFPFPLGRLASSSWSWSAGATYRWSGARTGFTADFVRQTTDGGGLQGSAQLTSVGFGISRRLSAKLKANIYGRYNVNDPTMPNAQFARRAHYGSAGASVTWEVRKNVSMTCSYSRQESRLPVLLGSDWFDRTRASLSINYSFSHPLGR